MPKQFLQVMCSLNRHTPHTNPKQPSLLKFASARVQLSSRRVCNRSTGAKHVPLCFNRRSALHRHRTAHLKTPTHSISNLAQSLWRLAALCTPSLASRVGVHDVCIPFCCSFVSHIARIWISNIVKRFSCCFDLLLHVLFCVVAPTTK